jgi:hypothetical protein
MYLVTARNVVLPPSKYKNAVFEHKSTSQRRLDVLALSETSFKGHLNFVQGMIDDHDQREIVEL